MSAIPQEVIKELCIMIKKRGSSIWRPDLLVNGLYYCDSRELVLMVNKLNPQDTWVGLKDRKISERHMVFNLRQCESLVEAQVNADISKNDEKNCSAAFRLITCTDGHMKTNSLKSKSVLN